MKDNIMTKRLKIDENISLRQIELTDATDIFNIINSQREYLGKWLPFVEYTQKVKDSEKFIQSVMNAPEEQFEYIFTIRYQGKFAGITGFRDSDKLNKKTEIGYWLSEDLQKKGIITKSVKRLCEFAFTDLGMNRIQIKCAVENTASKGIPKRLGFKHEGVERDGEKLTGGYFTDLDVFSLLKSEFKF